MPSNANLSPFAFLFPSWDAQVTRDYASSSLDPASLPATVNGHTKLTDIIHILPF